MQIQVRRLLLLSTMFGAISAIHVTGQTFGEITGRISDPTGAAISAAQITLTLSRQSRLAGTTLRLRKRHSNRPAPRRLKSRFNKRFAWTSRCKSGK
jgi:hypothetical protein